MSISLSGRTRVCGIIGDPIGHTMSPAMHNAAFKKLGIDYVYVAFRVKKESLDKAVAGMRALNIRGLNVTLPHKVAVMPLLDKIDPMAEKIGAVNTIVNDDGMLTGFNTDAAGFLQALREAGSSPEGKRVVILGAGGASRAVSFILAEHGADLVILNRQEERATELAQRIAGYSKKARASSLSPKNLELALKGADILVNTTSVGMTPNVNESLVPAHLLRPGLTVFDIISNPIKTRLLREAGAAGAAAISGIDMMVWQGVMAFEKWTGQQPPAGLMKKEAIKVVHEK